MILLEILLGLIAVAIGIIVIGWLILTIAVGIAEKEESKNEDKHEC